MSDTHIGKDQGDLDTLLKPKFKSRNDLSKEHSGTGRAWQPPISGVFHTRGYIDGQLGRGTVSRVCYFAVEDQPMN